MVFPQYRKRFDDKSFYKISSPTTFEEVLLIGKRFMVQVVHAQKYFEIVQVQSMLNLEAEMYQKSSQEEFEEKYEQAKKYLSDKKSKRI